MTARSMIQAALRTVPSILGETWQYRLLTSLQSAATPTYGGWANVSAHATGRSTLTEYDESRHQYVRREIVKIRISDVLAQINPGSEFKDPNGVYYACHGIETSGVGTMAYRLERIVATKQTENRQEAL